MGSEGAGLGWDEEIFRHFFFWGVGLSLIGKIMNGWDGLITGISNYPKLSCNHQWMGWKWMGLSSSLGITYVIIMDNAWDYITLLVRFTKGMDGLLGVAGIILKITMKWIIPSFPI